MYKQTLKRKNISVVLIILTIITFMILSCGCMVLFSMLNTIIMPGYFPPTSSTLTVLLAIFVFGYFSLKRSFSSFEYTIENNVLTIRQFTGKRIIKEVVINLDEISEIKDGSFGKKLYNNNAKKIITVILKDKKYSISPDEILLGMINGASFTDGFIDVNYDKMIDDLKGLITIPSVKEDAEENMPFGKPCADALKYTLDLCEKFGFETKNLDNYCGWAQIGEGEKLIAVLCHLDVVPAGDGWVSDPFEAVIKDDELFGRGAIDDKGPAISAIYALNAVKNELGSIPCRVRLIFGLDEESGWGCMERYEKTEEMPDMAFTPDAEYPVIITEKGIAQFEITGSLSEGRYQLYLQGGLRANMVPDKATATIIGDIDLLEKNIADYGKNADFSLTKKDKNTLIIETRGVGAHGSTPEKGVNAFFELFKFIDYLDLKDSQGKFVENMLNIFVDKTNGEGADLKLSDDISGALSLNLGMCFIGKNPMFTDMLDDTLKIVIDIRYPVSYSINDISSRLQSALPESWECDVLHYQAPHHVDENSHLVQTLMSVYKKYTLRNDPPLAIGGGTYARTLPNKAVAFGVQFPDKPDKAHQPNESISLTDLKLSAKMFATAIKKLINE